MKEALKLALDFIENSEGGTADLQAQIKAALAQSEQKPVGFVDSKLNPIQRTWVGLTDEEVDQFHNWIGGTWSTNELVRYVEAKLKEKNNG